MALVSPGLQLTVTDESQYVPGAVGTIPLVILATAQDKIANGTATSGTTKATAGKLQRFTSQRELVSALGYPVFKQSAAGTALHGDERNEYGLMAAYSSLGLGNGAFAVRADIDLAQLDATSVRPKGKVANGIYWLDLNNTSFGINEWTQGFGDTPGYFTTKTPIVITSLTTQTTGGPLYTPVQSVGAIGNYAVVVQSDVTYGTVNHIYYKNSDNSWVEVGSTDWEGSWPAGIAGTQNPVLTGATTSKVKINNTEVIIEGQATIGTIVSAINAANIDGVSVLAIDNRIAFYITSASASNGSIADGLMSITSDGVTSDVNVCNAIGVIDTEISGVLYGGPKLNFGTYVQVPSWRETDTQPRPTGSIWLKTTAKGNGANLAFKIYNSTNDLFTSVAAPLYANEESALYGLDPSAGGSTISIGSLYVEYNIFEDGTPTSKAFRRAVSGQVSITGTTPLTTPVFNSGHQIVLRWTEPGSPATDSVQFAVGGTTSAAFVAAILAQDIPNIYAQIESNGAITIIHRTGGTIYLSNVGGGTALATAGFTSSTTNVRVNYANTAELVLSGFRPLTYTYSTVTPYQAPEDGTLWYYGDPLAVDILVNTGTTWHGYLNGGIDARGYNLANTDPAGPILSAVQPADGDRSDGGDLVPGDLWIDTGDLQNYPKLYRYNDAAVGKWIAIDNTDSINQNGIVFADARWDTTGTTDPITGTLPSTTDLLSSNYVDLDCPDARLYPRGTLLFNTRRGGFNVKQYVSKKFTASSYPDEAAADQLPSIAAAWVTASGNKDDGSPYMGHLAQRRMIVKAMKAAISASTEIREERFAFSLICAPGYPELISDMVGLNNDRKNTAFIIGDTPMTLPANGVQLTNWSNGVSGVYGDGLTTADPYLGVFYPAAQTTDVQGNSIVVPPSHMMLRTFIRSDNVSYQWFAPAGTRRGLIDNATKIGYLSNSGTTNLFVETGVNQGLRDVMYPININPITVLTGIGLTAFGQKTRNPTASALDRINVARLVNYIRTILANVGNGFLFEPNDKITRDQLKSIIEGAMNDLVAKRGLYDYLVVCDGSNNTPERIARNELYVDIAIEPMKDVEFIYIPIRLKNPGDIAKGV